ncbi:MAG: DUF1553 domain-containing protein [Verrucomicrobiales bacterium]|nr:DUF1553 domain-containing protein [Verrucomicrobiales bacterium]
MAIVAIDDSRADHLVKPSGTGKNPAGEKPGFANDRGSEKRSPNVSGGEYTWWENKPGKEVAAWRPHLEGRYRVWLSWGAGHQTHTKDAVYWIQTPKRKRTLVARVNQQLLADGSGDVSNQSLWSGFRDGGVYDFQKGDSIVLVGGQIGTAITADIVLFEPVSAEEAGKAENPQPAIREPVNAAHNREYLASTPAKFVRFTIDSSSSAQPCIDELEIFSGQENIALAERGAKVSSSGDFRHALHKLEHINDGKYGNAHSWIAAKSTGWVQIELAHLVEIDRIEWARDREKRYTDRVPVKYRIEVAETAGDWRLVASSDDRLSFGTGKKEGATRYDFASHPPEEAERGRRYLARIEAALKQREEAAKPQKIYAGTFKQPGPTHRLYRGEPDAKREEVGPNAITAFVSLDLEKSAPEQKRRLALADWIADPANPLTARVIANRIWQFHFGTGLVDTPGDFGKNGTPPSHPELLDFLALELMENGWSLKKLHRKILHSKTWQQDSRPDQTAVQVDAGTRLLWRFPPRRLEAEAIRDSILAVSGSLDLDKPGGPGFSPFEVEMENVRHYHPKKNYGPEDWRRMVYMQRVRQERDSVFGAFDCPDATQAVGARSRSTTPLQALNLLNSRFVNQQAEIFEKRLEATEDRAKQIDSAFRLCFGRPAAPDEISSASDFIDSEGLIQFTRAMLNTNEFIFIH